MLSQKIDIDLLLNLSKNLDDRNECLQSHPTAVDFRKLQYHMFSGLEFSILSNIAVTITMSASRESVGSLRPVQISREFCAP